MHHVQGRRARGVQGRGLIRALLLGIVLGLMLSAGFEAALARGWL